MPAPRIPIASLPEQVTLEDDDYFVLQDGATTKKMLVGKSTANTAAQLAAHTGDTADAHLATAIGATANAAPMTGTTVQAQLAQAATAVAANTSGLADHLADPTAAHAATAVSATASTTPMVGTTVQAQLGQAGTMLNNHNDSINILTANLTTHLTSPTGQHVATAVSLAAVSGLTATNVQTGIAQLAARGGTPVGGTTGQVLTKNSGADGDVGWATPSGGGGGVTDGDKGDIVVSGTGTVWSIDSAVVTTAARTVLDDVSTAAMLTTLGAQPVDTDLTTIAGLTATTDNVIQSVGSAWASRTPAQLKATLALAKGDVGLGNVDNTSDVNKPVSTAQQTALNLKQDADADLTTIAGLTATTNNIIQSVGSAWASRTPAQVKTALSLVAADVGLGSVTNNAQYFPGGTDVAVADGGTGASTKAAGFDALSPMTTSGDVIYGGAAGTGTRLAKGTDGQVLKLVAGLPAWATDNTGAGLADGDYGDIVVSGTGTAINIDTAVITAAAKTVLDDTTVVAMLATLGGQAAGTPLTQITTAGVPTADGDFLVGAAAGTTWTRLALSSAKAVLGIPVAGIQPLDTDLTTIAGLTATTDNVIQSVGSAWASRTPAQLKTSMTFVKADVGLGSVDNTADTAKPVSTAQQTALDLKSNITQTLNAQTGTTYTFVLTDADKLVTGSNASAETFTVPLNSSVAYPIGTHIDVVQIGAGKITIAATGGVTINATPSLGFRAQYSAATLIKIATDTWVLVGDLA